MKSKIHISKTSKHRPPRYYKLKSTSGKFENLCNHISSSFCRANKISPVDMVYSSTEFNSFLSMNEQDLFLSTYIHIKQQLTKQKSSSVYFNVQLKSKSVIRVCLNSFCTYFGIGRRRVTTLSKKIKNKDQNSTSKRGGSRQQQKITSIINTIKTHISSFPTEISHYNRSHESENITYLEDNITLSDMLSDFNSTHEQKATYWLYYKTFHTQFKICFKKPRT